jgi:hypothetical protein
MIEGSQYNGTQSWDWGMGSDVRVTLLKPSDSVWATSVKSVDHDIYHLPEYVSFAARQEGGTAVATYATWDDNWLLVPLVMLTLPHDLDGRRSNHVDVHSPYGYSSPLTNVKPHSGGVGITGLLRAFQASIDSLAAQGAVSLFVRMHPLLPMPIEALEPFDRVVCHGDTVFVDLANSDDELWKQTRPSHRQDILTAQRRGAVAYIDDDWQRFDDFFAIYHETMQRVQAEDFYLFSKSHFLGLRDAMGERIHLSVVEDDGAVVAAGIVSEESGLVETHFSGTRDTFLKWSPNKVRINFLRSWAKARGNRYLHLGGGVGARRDSLFEFKLGFSRQIRAFHTARLVLNKKVYHEGINRWESAHGVRADDIDGFFPSYRKP